MEGEEEANLESFLQWAAAALGISDSNTTTTMASSSSSCLGHTLSVANFPEAGGRGLAATRAISKGELILKVPNSALMTSDCLIRNDRNFSDALRKYRRLLSSTQILSIALVNELDKGKSSWWYPYLKQIPRSYDLLASFGQFEIEALQIDDAIWTAEKAVQKGKTEWEEAKPLMSELNLKPQLITFKAWLWASATISSRTMHIPWDTAGCLCPVGDFFNYAPPEEEPDNLKDPTACGTSSNSTVEMFDTDVDRLTDAGYDEAVASYCFYAKRHYREGDQVLLSYGTYTNLELLEHYGFLLHENPNDKAFISLEPEMYSLCSWPKDSLYISQDGNPSFALLSTIRLWSTPLVKRKSIKYIAFSGHIISFENEVAVMDWLAKRCQVLLSSYSTSIEEDTLMLHIIEKNNNFNLSSWDCEETLPALHNEIRSFLESNNMKTRKSIYRWQLAVKWRLGYKRILSDCISYCNKMLDNHSRCL